MFLGPSMGPSMPVRRGECLAATSRPSVLARLRVDHPSTFLVDEPVATGPQLRARGTVRWICCCWPGLCCSFSLSVRFGQLQPLEKLIREPQTAGLSAKAMSL